MDYRHFNSRQDLTWIKCIKNVKNVFHALLSLPGVSEPMKYSQSANSSFWSSRFLTRQDQSSTEKYVNQHASPHLLLTCTEQAPVRSLPDDSDYNPADEDCWGQPPSLARSVPSSSSSCTVERPRRRVVRPRKFPYTVGSRARSRGQPWGPPKTSNKRFTSLLILIPRSVSFSQCSVYISTFQK